MRVYSTFILVFFLTLSVFPQKGISLSGRILSETGQAVADQTVFVVFEQSAAPYVTLNHQLITNSNGFFSISTSYLPDAIFPLELKVYTYDCDYQRKGYLATYPQNNLSGTVNISVCVGPSQLPPNPILVTPPDPSCPGFLQVSTNPGINRNYLKEFREWTLNNEPKGHDPSFQSLLQQPNNLLKLNLTYVDSLTGFPFDSLQMSLPVNLPDTIFHILGGNVLINGTTTNIGKAVLLGQSGNHFFVADTTAYTQYGYYYFVNAPTCKYSVRIIEADDAMINEAIPTYLGGALHWNSSPFMPFNDDCYNANLNVVPQQISSGSGEIFGQLFSADSRYYDVILYTQDMTPFSYAECSPDGHFHFQFLPFGTYYMYSEKFGVEPVSASVSLSISNPTASVILSPTAGFELYEEKSVSIFPNPADRLINIEPAPGANVQIFSADGRLVLETTGETTQIDVSSLDNGVYHMQYYVESELFSASFVVKH